MATKPPRLKGRLALMPRLTNEPASLRRRRDESFYRQERISFLIIVAFIAIDVVIAVWR